MNIQEYKKQFIALYDKLQAEHGSVKSVSVTSEVKNYDFTGGVVYDNVECEITF